MTSRKPLAGEVLLRRLLSHGVEFLFANSGTDFAPIIEGLVEARRHGEDVIEALVIPHEHAAVSMAHGYYLATGRPQAVMVHTNVGLANTVLGVLNAAAEQVPMLICSGRTPVTEQGRPGSRTTPINWGQDMRDQGAMLRESVKWDFTLHYPEQTAELVDRAMTVAKSSPRGPVYLSLPREALTARTDLKDGLTRPIPAPARAAPHPADVMQAAEILLKARAPLIISHDANRSAADFEALTAFTENHAIPLVDFWASRISVPTTGAMHAGFDVAAEIEQADAVLVLNNLAPWIPARHRLRRGTKVIQVGNDPHHSRYPIRDFPANVALTGDCATVVAALSDAMKGRVHAERTSARHRSIAERTSTRKCLLLDQARAGAGTPVSKAWVSKCVSDVLTREDGVVVTEMGVEPAYMNFTYHDRYYGAAVSGGLGWGLPAALGVQLADRARLVIATVGDGSYMFANPVVCHQVAAALELPLLTVVFNNGRWNAVRRSTLDIFPDGAAAQEVVMPVTSLEPAPDYCLVAQASGAWTVRVENGADLPGVLDAAVQVIRGERRQALIEIRTTP
jgi:acetolactate synthase-1/2/3 large subunit